MQTRFFAPHEVFNYFESGKIESDISDIEMLAICSIIDLLDMCELYKKQRLHLSYSELQQKVQQFYETLVETGQIVIVDLDQDNLSSVLFERDITQEVTNLWNHACNRSISPKQSIRYLTLRLIDDSTWWSEDVYLEMENYHKIQDE